MQTMYANFEAEQRNLLMFPLRSEANTMFNVASYMQKLIKDGVETLESLCNKPYAHLKLEYFPRAEWQTINEAFTLIKGLQTA